MTQTVQTLFFSPTKGTQKIVESVAKGIGMPTHIYDITLPSHRLEALDFTEDTLLIVGVPVYAGRVPEVVTEYLQKVKGNHTKAVFIAVYGNRAYEDALLELKQTMEGNGFVGVGAGAFIGEHSYTPLVATDRPDEEDLMSAFNFGVEVKKILQTLKNSSVIVPLKVNGKTPYREKMSLPPMAPVTNEDCTQCGLCAEHCPTGAISTEDCKDINDSKCIRCFACIKVCPVRAKTFEHEFVVKMTQTLIQNCSALRKDPELFFIDC